MMELNPPPYVYCPLCGLELGTITDEGKSHKYCNRCRWTYYPRSAASVSAIVLHHGQVLLVQRAREPFKDTWMFPSGFVDFGEHPEEAVARELEEETGLIASATKLLAVHLSPDDPRELGHFVFFYRVEAMPGDLRNDPDENQAIGWFDPRQLPKVAWQLHQRYLAELNDP